MHHLGVCQGGVYIQVFESFASILFFKGHTGIYAGNPTMVAATGHFPDHTQAIITR